MSKDASTKRQFCSCQHHTYHDECSNCCWCNDDDSQLANTTRRLTLEHTNLFSCRENIDHTKCMMWVDN